MKIILCALLASAVPLVALAAPAKKAAAKTSVVSVDPNARAIWSRAIALYHGTQNLRIVWRNSFEENDSSLDFSRVGLLRLSNPSIEELSVVDGKISWHLDGLEKPKSYTREPIEQGEAYPTALSALDLSGSSFTDEISGFLGARQTLWPSQIKTQMNGLKMTEYRVTLLPAQKQNGELCDLVRFNWVYPNLDKTRGQTNRQQTHWFARSDGRLLRFQERIIVGKNEPLVSDCQIKVQDFNPKFTPETFKFVPPKGAKMEKD